ncbi:MAG: hypothetical protein A2341_02525 [Deltaproteobacteria bacterium RIFOXYB12_FULL_58_9]|nr:MAG: hypothetical protein A2341_02525 [Deltaproteobacteria bacterium RIFOXYB12_FULL_58_9]
MSREGLMLWVIHRLADELKDHAVLKGGMALRLLESPRYTNDLDFVAVPYTSKKEIAPVIERILGGLEGAKVQTTLHSKMIRSVIQLDDAAVQLEISVSARCDSIPVSTAPMARSEGLPPQVVRIMAPDVALAHKLAAWNERRLLRDLYDVYFLAGRVGATPNADVLTDRLARVQSRLPKLRSRRRMSVAELLVDLSATLDALTDAEVEREIGGLVDAMELPGLAARIRVTLRRVMEQLSAG